MAMEVRSRPPRSGPPFGFVPTVWSVGWISLFIFGDWQLAIPAALLTLPVSALGWRWRRSARQRLKRWRAESRGAAPDVVRGNARDAIMESPRAWELEHRMDRVAVRAQTSGGRVDAEAVALVREIVALLQPLLAHVRERGTDVGVRHDIEAIAGEHLPAVIDAYLALPKASLQVPTASGLTPAASLRQQLSLLLAGVRELDEGVTRADLAHQQELGRFLDAKFRRSDLTL